MIGRTFRRAGRYIFRVRDTCAQARAILLRGWLERRLRGRGIHMVNLCCGQQKVEGYFGIDANDGADLRLDLARINLPFQECSLKVIVCMSAINYFTRARARELIGEMHRVLEPGGVCRVGVQDMKSLAERYIRGDEEFFFQKLVDGRDRFEGPTIGDKFAAWFYGYSAGTSHCKYFYDFASLAYLFDEAGFELVERKNYRESRIAEIEQLDNRADQMFFLEATK